MSRGSSDVGRRYILHSYSVVGYRITDVNIYCFPMRTPAICRAGFSPPSLCATKVAPTIFRSFSRLISYYSRQFILSTHVSFLTSQMVCPLSCLSPFNDNSFWRYVPPSRSGTCLRQQRNACERGVSPFLCLVSYNDRCNRYLLCNTV